ncbi:MAG: M20/M25/M40 family metallo-hydrolase [Chloroflexi bacterium]|nr:M20/M25/M40 family metallo-hydrolase [Chloroflexota bacterium]
MDQDVVDLLQHLVSIDSVNPTLVAGGAGEQAIAAYIANWAERCGLRCAVVGQPSGRPSVIIRGGSPMGGGKTLLLCAHLDTVGYQGMHDALIPRIDGDRLYGRGAYDMKAGLAAALICCRDAARARTSGEVVVAAVADEEHSSVGIVEALRHITADGAIVTEPTELAVVTAHKGFVWIEIEVMGKAAHGSRPQLGVDAILKTGPVLVAIDQLNRSLNASDHPRLGTGSVHASVIAGGIGESTIPDQCRLTLERRTLPGDTAQSVQREIDELLDACRRADNEFRAIARVTLARDALETAESAQIVATTSGAVSEVLGKPAELHAASYWADSAFISAAGIPTVLFGPSGVGAHAEVEWVSLSSSIACTRALANVARRFCHVSQHHDARSRGAVPEP